MAEINEKSIEQIITNLGGTLDKLIKVYCDENHEYIDDMLLDVSASIIELVDNSDYKCNEWTQTFYDKAVQELKNQNYNIENLVH